MSEQDHPPAQERDANSPKEEEVRQAFYRWQEVAREWSEVYRSFSQESGSLLFERRRQLRALEKRLNDAADAYEQARQQVGQNAVPS